MERVLSALRPLVNRIHVMEIVSGNALGGSASSSSPDHPNSRATAAEMALGVLARSSSRMVIDAGSVLGRNVKSSESRCASGCSRIAVFTVERRRRRSASDAAPRAFGCACAVNITGDDNTRGENVLSTQRSPDVGFPETYASGRPRLATLSVHCQCSCSSST